MHTDNFKLLAMIDMLKRVLDKTKTNKKKVCPVKVIKSYTMLKGRLER